MVKAGMRGKEPLLEVRKKIDFFHIVEESVATPLAALIQKMKNMLNKLEDLLRTYP